MPDDISGIETMDDRAQSIRGPRGYSAYGSIRLTNPCAGIPLPGGKKLQYVSSVWHTISLTRPYCPTLYEHLLGAD